MNYRIIEGTDQISLDDVVRLLKTTYWADKRSREQILKSMENSSCYGIVLEGRSNLDTVALTGESVPRSIGPDDEVLSGCVNLSGVLRVRATKAFGESTASKILDLVENALLSL